jgi:hypothetical protein
MNGGVAYALLLGSEMVLLFDAAPQPWGSLVFWALQTAQLSVAVVRRRTGLIISTAGGTAAALGGALALALSAAGHTWGGAPVLWKGLLCLLVAVVPISFIAEARVHRSAWDSWTRHAETKGLWDILLLRHIPDFRNGGA